MLGNICKLCSVCLISLSIFLTPTVHAEPLISKDVQSRAEMFLETIRQQEWNKLVNYTVVGAGSMDQKMRTRLEIPPNADSVIIKAKIGNWFR